MPDEPPCDAAAGRLLAKAIAKTLTLTPNTNTAVTCADSPTGKNTSNNTAQLTNDVFAAIKYANTPTCRTAHDAAEINKMPHTPPPSDHHGGTANPDSRT